MPNISERTSRVKGSMGHGRSDYEGYYGVDLNKPRYGYHCHDFYEFFLHISGARDFGVDNEMYLLQPNQLFMTLTTPYT